jgi:CheY-like chemotaxis protein
MDDDAGDRRQLSRLLSRGELQAELTQADGPENALGLGTAHFDAILLDNHMPTLNGIDLLRDLRRKWPYGAVIMMAGQSNEEVAKHAPKEQLCKNALLRVLQNGVAFARAGTH